MKFKFSKQAVKAINKMDRDLKERIRKGIKNLPDGDVKMLQNRNPKAYRLRIGKYRIIYRKVSDSELCIDKIDSRGDIYK